MKRIATTPSVTDVFWVAAEDGTVMQYDLREPNLPSEQSEASTVLLNLNAHCGVHIEVKCIAVNHTRPELLAVGCNDPYVRVYDRRFLKTRPLTNPALAASALRGDESGEESTKKWNSPTEWSIPECAAVYYTAGIGILCLFLFVVETIIEIAHNTTTVGSFFNRPFVGNVCI